MKSKIIISIVLAFTALGCNKLDLDPLSEGSSENWYSNESELDMAVAALYNIVYWESELTRIAAPGDYESEWTDKFTDDWTARATLSDVTAGTTSSQTNFVTTVWTNAYKCIASANGVLTNLHKAENVVTAEKLARYQAQAKFARAAQYAKLIFLYGDVPFYTEVLDIDHAFALSRTDKKTILKSIYEDYDFAVANLPVSYGDKVLKFPTKGAALAMKARIAIYMGDWQIARDAAKACIDLNVYKLFPDFYTLLLSKTKNSTETIFATPRSVELKSFIPLGRSKEPTTRIVGGFGNGGPSWDLFCSFLCKDGLPIDESPLYNPQLPFKNRDPRCTATIVEFHTPWLGYIFEPHPDSLTVLNLNTGKAQSNADSRGVGQYASYNGLTWKKKIDDDWLDLYTAPDNIVIRYADLLLIYAEAKIELGEIDQTVLNAMNQVRARGYGATISEINKYPVININSQAALRKLLRIERRMEFAFEGLRYYDIIRWKLAEKVLNTPMYGMLEVADLREKVIKPGLWFFPSTPAIDEDGVADFSSMYNQGQVALLAMRKFDKGRQYLWPIPATEIQINKNLTQNPGY